jgi:CRISPR/Cas system CMR subunit Cmr4 (Cas7 group RAMP superfamily)
MSQESEGSVWFWRLFGGAIIGLTAILFGVILNGFNNNMGRMSDELLIIRAKVAALEEFRETTKEGLKTIEINFKDKTIEKQINEVRERLIKIEQKIPTTPPSTTP